MNTIIKAALNKNIKGLDLRIFIMLTEKEYTTTELSTLLKVSLTQVSRSKNNLKNEGLI